MRGPNGLLYWKLEWMVKRKTQASVDRGHKKLDKTSNFETLKQSAF